MSQPKVIVLILSYNGKALLLDAITSYLENDYENYEIVVIDNGSIDGTKAYVNENWPSVEVYRTDQNLGYSGGFNFGLSYAFKEKKADYVVISNNDVKADRGLVKALVNTASNDSMIGFITGKVYYFENPTVFQTVGYIENPATGEVSHKGQKEVDEGQYDADIELVNSDDVFMLVTKAVYDKVGGFDLEYFIQNEQWDWQERGKKLGYKVYYSYGAKLWHKESMTIGKQSAFKYYYDVRNTLLVIFRHKSAKQFSTYFWKSVKNHLVKGTLKHFLKGNFAHSRSAFTGFWSGFFRILRSGKLSIKHFL